jgi:hypothetical protein
MKSSPAPYSSAMRARPVLPRPPRMQPATTMRSTVLLSLLLAPDGGAEIHRHGQGSTTQRTG